MLFIILLFFHNKPALITVPCNENSHELIQQKEQGIYKHTGLHILKLLDLFLMYF